MNLTAKVVLEIRDHLANGCDLETACAAVGATAVEATGWIHDGHVARESSGKVTKYEERCVQIVEAHLAARARVEVDALAAIHRAARDGSWQAAAWWLERANPDRYGKPKAGDGSHGGARPGSGRPTGASSAPDRVMRAEG